MHKTIGALLITAAISLAQPPGITREIMATSAATFDQINHVPAFYGARHNAGHTATVFHPGGEFANVASNWLLWTLKGDRKAGAMFVGKDCSLCTNPNWDTRSKGINQ